MREVRKIYIFWLTFNAQKMKFSIKDFFSKSDQTHSVMHIWTHFLKKSLIENSIFLCSPCEQILLRLYVDRVDIILHLHHTTVPLDCGVPTVLNHLEYLPDTCQMSMYVILPLFSPAIRVLVVLTLTKRM